MGLFHATYNIISMTIILTLFSPIQHALLNVAKRVTVVLGFFIVTFSTANTVSLTNVFSAVSCIVIIVFGNRHIKDQQQSEGTKSKTTPGVLIGGALLLVLLILLLSTSPNLSSLSSSQPQ